ncbi:hypothetical protein PMA3_06525 [Pseudomonas silesiensis]|uniref:Uncharacterized protein n=1 Tax=Pseudomonas silesiensis TaxID=1853130 RepID=A0A191YPZ9_9PSED|nr:hypothetical protein [Pseudomonas silesiensis]ANJ54834.1 hypothetical protein PMA3_06525 [Pseudomonas silesiensis]
MRIPIYPADLNPQKGFKRIAKVIHRDWPGPEPVNLSAAREILARCFGYKDYHDVTRSADGWPDDASAPEVEDLRAAILVSLANQLHAESSSISVDLERLTTFVESLPLKVLQTYRLSRANHPEG